MQPTEASVFTFGIVAVSRRSGLSIAKTTPRAKIRFQSLLSRKLNASSTALWRKVSYQRSIVDGASVNFRGSQYELWLGRVEVTSKGHNAGPPYALVNSF
jgi:hypothetical protein